VAAGARPPRLGLTMRLVAENLTIGYGARVVGSGISLVVRPGEVLCLLGPNGAGKTTLFRTLLGLQPALAGKVAIDGVPLEFLRPADIAQRLAYVPQAHVTEFSYLVLDVVLMGRTSRLRSFAGPGSEDRRIALGKLGSLGIGDLAGADYTQISGGQRQLVLIARALTQGAPFLIMDEPTASLDFGNQALVLARIRELAAEGYGIVLSTHDPDHALLVGTRVAIIVLPVAAGARPPRLLTRVRLSNRRHRLIGVQPTQATTLPPPFRSVRRMQPAKWSGTSRAMVMARGGRAP
jgi:iron complex transport system ATP-binding protein